MRNFIVKTTLTVASLIMAANLAFAVDAKIEKKAPAKVEAAKKAETKPAAAKEEKKEEKATAGKAEPVDINSASEAELKAIPGLGDAYVAKIIVNRPYANKTQLKSRKVIPDALYEKIKDQIIAKQPKKK